MTEPTTEETERTSKTITLAGRDVECYVLNEGQVFQLAHESRVLEGMANGDQQRLLKAMDRVFRIFRSIIKDEKDIDWVEDSMADGTITLTMLIDNTRDLMDERAKEAKPRVQRARAKRR